MQAAMVAAIPKADRCLLQFEGLVCIFWGN
jgi:hypothetical protein